MAETDKEGLLCIEYPGKVENVERMIETLGGLKVMGQVGSSFHCTFNFVHLFALMPWLPFTPKIISNSPQNKPNGKYQKKSLQLYVKHKSSTVIVKSVSSFSLEWQPRGFLHLPNVSSRGFTSGEKRSILTYDQSMSFNCFEQTYYVIFKMRLPYRLQFHALATENNRSAVKTVLNSEGDIRAQQAPRAEVPSRGCVLQASLWREAHGILWVYLRKIILFSRIY